MTRLLCMMMITIKVEWDAQIRRPKGYGFMSYTDFESADMAIESMNGQFLMNKPITIQNALKNDRKSKRHGTAAEQLLGTEAWKKMRCHLLTSSSAAEMNDK
ncbi:hypothetical protein BC827DRAFT_1273462 [Russula dissimulans]|nr:hypothetical protein BC827DRAFT_1273462 [Russula dissimulans]